jgi:asparagine synthase (glutamine-hydrolysing)
VRARITDNVVVCGIAGFWSFSGGTADEMHARAASMTRCLLHRGPDDEGLWIDAPAGIALGFRRLAIIDLSAAGAQPMVSASGRYVIVFNGEVFNFQRLRHRLESEGRAPVWRGHSDTEVMLAAIEAWGIQRAVQEFIGIFAIALWDRQERALTLVRDRAGVKPLYFAVGSRAVAFASELKSLEDHAGLELAIDPDAAAQYAHYRYVPAPRTIYRGVEKLLPGTSLTVLRDGTTKRSTYWDPVAIAEAKAGTFRGTDADALASLEALLSDSVSLRMIADVPLGAFLSGGVDSSLITALMQRHATEPVRTFTIGFEDRTNDEAEFGRDVARHLQTNHTEAYITADEALRLIPQLPRMYDEPFADSSALPTHLVSRLARASSTVALSGDGGDELFAGYHHHFLGARVDRRVQSIPQVARPLLGHLLRAAPRTRALGAALLEDDLFATYLRGMTSRELRDDEPSADKRTVLRLSAVENVMLHDFRTYLVDDILTKVDRASMAVSLEVRTPFLDHRVVELAWSLPLSMKIREDRGKWILKALLRRFLPDRLVDREKRGFGLPLSSWLRGPLRAWAESLLATCDEPFDRARVRKLWQRHLAGENHENDLWIVLMFEAWRTR